MLVIGGTQPSSPLTIAALDPWPSGLGIFDMSAFAWSGRYDPSAATYEQPVLVSDYYTYRWGLGTSILARPIGSLTITRSYQVPVWGSPALEPIFGESPALSF
jgi:hypothetical protein